MKTSRRDFNTTLLATFIGAGLTGIHGATTASMELDRFGGWKGRPFKATGFFHLEKDERWWLVTPEGNAFLSFGINHVEPDLFRQAYNREAWQKRLGVADLDDAATFTPALRSWVLETCREYGFNTVGHHNSLPVLNRPTPAVPYLQTIVFIDIPHWRPVVPDTNCQDVIAPEFATHCERLAQQIAGPLKDDPFLIGYAMTDGPLFTQEINGDSAFTTVTDTMPRPFGPVADNLTQRAQWTDEFFRRAFARPDFVGWHYCGLIDASQRVPRKQDRQHSGLLDGFGHPYPEIQQALKTATAELYEIAIRQR
jgi:hypothetical protein